MQRFTAPAVIAATARVLILLAAGLVLASPVAAHAELVSSDPAANASLPDPPPRVVLTFSEPLDPAWARISLLNEAGAEVSEVGAPAVDEGGTRVEVALPDLEPGTYTVAYRVTSAVDGHVTFGTFTFLVDPTGIEPPPSGSAASGSPSAEPILVAARWAALVMGLALLGIALFWLVSVGPARRTAGPRTAGVDPDPAREPWAVLAALGGLTVVSLLAYLSLAAGTLADPGAGEVGQQTGSGLPLDPLGPFGWTPFALAMRLALLAAAVATGLAMVRAVRGRDGGTASKWLGRTAVAAALSLAGSSLAGHAAALGSPLTAGLDWIHLVAAAAWLGALPGLILFAARLHALPDRFPGLLRAVVARHSRLAMVAAPTVVLTGLANSPLVLGSTRDAVASGYGNLLLAKGVLVSVALGIGAANWFLVRGATVRRTLPLIGAELAIGAAAVLAAAAMVTGQPAATRVPVLSEPPNAAAHLFGSAGDSSVHVAVNLPAPGRQRYQAALSDPDTGLPRTDVEGVVLVFHPPPESRRVAERVALEPGEPPWVWGATGAHTPELGTWMLEVLVSRPGQPDAATSFELPVREPLAPQPVPPLDTGWGVPTIMAAAWRIFPAGPARWAPLGLLAGALLVVLVGRRGVASSRALSAVRTVLLAAGVLAGVTVGSRLVVEAANLPPSDAVVAKNPVTARGDSIERGRRIYLANCATCHGAEGGGDGPAADAWAPPPDLAGVVPTMTDGALAYRVAVGTAGTRMPGFASTLSEHDRWDLVNYLRTRRPGGE